jgi:hypothetical protein
VFAGISPQHRPKVRQTCRTARNCTRAVVCRAVIASRVCDNGFSSLPSDPSINEKGEVAFQGNLRRLSLPTTRPECETLQPGETPRQGVFLDNTGGLSAGDPSLNIFGRVAFTGTRFDKKGNQIFSINTSRGDGVTTVAESGPRGYSSFREPSLTDLGAVAFTAEVQPDPKVFTTVQGVFTGPDPNAPRCCRPAIFTKACR